MDLLCYGPVEKGVDASDGSLEYYGYGLEGGRALPPWPTASVLLTRGWG